MNAQQYKEYKSNVAEFLRKNHVKPGCHAPERDQQEPFFSWRPCECCQRDLSGDRETYTFAMDRTSGETFTADICSDCVYYLTYDRLDDATMEEIEDGRSWRCAPNAPARSARTTRDPANIEPNRTP